MTSRAKSRGIPEGLSSTAIFCRTLILFVSSSHRTEPAPPRRMISVGSGPGIHSTPGIWVSWPIFSSRLIRPRRASTCVFSSVSGIVLIVSSISDFFSHCDERVEQQTDFLFQCHLREQVFDALLDGSAWVLIGVQPPVFVQVTIGKPIFGLQELYRRGHSSPFR